MLKLVSPELQDDEEVVRVAMTNDPYALTFAAERMKKNKKLCLLMLEHTNQFWHMGEFAECQNCRDCPSFCQYGSNLPSFWKHVSGEPWEDRDFVMQVVGADGLLLKYASPKLKKDLQIAMLAVVQNGNALAHVSPDILNAFGADPEKKQLVIDAVRKDWRVLRHVPCSLCNTAQWDSPDMQVDKLVLQAARESVCEYTPLHKSSSGNFVALMPAVFRRDKQIVLGVININSDEKVFGSTDRMKGHCEAGHALQELMEDTGNPLIDDEEILIAAVSRYGNGLMHVPRAKCSREVVSAAFEHAKYWMNPDDLKQLQLHVPEEMQHDSAFWKELGVKPAHSLCSWACSIM